MAGWDCPSGPPAAGKLRQRAAPSARATPRVAPRATRRVALRAALRAAPRVAPSARLRLGRQPAAEVAAAPWQPLPQEEQPAGGAGLVGVRLCIGTKNWWWEVHRQSNENTMVSLEGVKTFRTYENK